MANKGGRERKQPFQKLYAKGQGSSFKRATGALAGIWQAVWTYRDENDNQKRRYFYGKTEKEARDKMLDWKAGGGEDRQGDWTVEDLFDFLLDEESDQNPKGGYFEQQGRQKSNTLFDYRSMWLRHVKPRIGGMKLSRVKAQHLDSILLDIMNDPERPVSRRTALNVRRMIAVCFKEGVRLGRVSKNPAPNMMKIDVPKFRATIFNVEQIQKLIEETEGKPVQLAIMLAGMCALREAEIAGLMLSDFDPKTASLRIARQYQQVRGGGLEFQTPKTEAGIRTIPLPPMVAEALGKVAGTSLYLFPQPGDDGRPVHPTRIYHWTMAALEDAELPKIRFHDLRHSANNILKQLGVDATTRRDILGHSTTLVTENVYTQTVSAEMVTAMGRIEKAYGKDAKKRTSRMHSV